MALPGSPTPTTSAVKARRRRDRETPEIAAMTRRMIAALGRRVGEGDPCDLAELESLRVAVDQALHAAVTTQREVTGFSWAEIAAGLRIGRSAAHERFGANARRSA